MWNETLFLLPICHLYLKVRLEWPTDLAINPMDNSIYVLDNNVVLQITENRQVLSIPILTAVHVLQTSHHVCCFLDFQAILF